MEKKKWASKRVASIRIEPYLAEYIQKRFKIDEKTGGIKIPYTTDLYHVVWNLMSKPVTGASSPEDSNLKIFLPCRRSGADELPGKDPAYYNYLSRSAARKVEASIRLMFNFDLHRVMLENEEQGRPRRNQDVAEDFVRRYGLTTISSESLLKNFYRFRNKLFPKKTRKYQKKR